ncbi:MAG TPA: DUF87 domain-containing protein [Marinilabiliaceae bacterium]|nr:DUF87 domain-containing protein [Marinilabiliaceae bacterium]
MKYGLLSKTICDYIIGEIGRGAKTLRFVLPSYPSKLLLEIGEMLKDYIDRILDQRIELHYGVAYHLGEHWRTHGSSLELSVLEKIKQNGWYDQDNSLTKMRNRLPGTEVDCLIILMAGFEHIQDQGSLQDFFNLNQATVWELCLKKSFIKWVEQSHQDYLSPEDEKTELQLISDLLCVLYQNGLTDLVGISDYLGNRDYTGIMNGHEAYQSILDDLFYFNLPKLGSLSKNKGKGSSILSYVVAAQSFMNYSLFLKSDTRKKALERIQLFKDNGKDQLTEEYLGNYQNPDELLNDLLIYVGNQDKNALNRLIKADFPFIHDCILNYKTGSGQKKPKGLVKLYGVPPEVFLRAMVITLRDFLNKKGNIAIILEEPFTISIQSTLFKHDFDQDKEENEEHEHISAKKFLRHILGGIDHFLEEKLSGEVFQNKCEIKSCLSYHEQNKKLGFYSAKRSEPFFAFDVSILPQNGGPFTRSFKWVLPQYHASRVLGDLLDWAYEALTSGVIGNGEALPAFFVSYLPELFQAKDEEEVNRIITQGLQANDREVISLLNKNDPINNDERRMADSLFREYQNFLQEYDQKGFFYAINKFTGFRKAYQELCEEYLKESNSSILGPFLLKAFMIVSLKQKAENWRWSKYLQSAVVTPLHPSMLQMLIHQYKFLIDNFSFYLKKALENPRGKDLSERTWDQVVDLAKIQRPVFGILEDDNLVLNTNVRGFGYIHLVGDCKEGATSDTSRFLLDYDNDEEEKISDTDLFRKTRESALIMHLISDYVELHPHAMDGITIGVFCGENIQPIITGVNDYLDSMIKIKQSYSMNIIFYSDSNDDSAVMKWLNAWKVRLEESNSQRLETCFYSITISYCAVPNNFEQFIRQIKTRSFDVYIFSNFMRSNSSHFIGLDKMVSSKDDYQKFPILDKVCCRQIGAGHDLERERILSHKQFKLASLHGEIMERIRTDHQSEKTHLIVGKYDYGDWNNVIDGTHQVSTWVICIDPVIDEYLLRNGLDGKREIIGFGTGVGSHGESNYTVSTEKFTFDDVKRKIGLQILANFKSYEQNTSTKMADSIIKEASNIGGLSIVRATGPKDNHIHDYMAYAMVRKLLPKDPGAFCDEVISLDAFRHWFNDTDRRPDLLRIQAYINGSLFQIKAQIIECKLAQYNEGYLAEARQQIEAGLNHLIDCFKPRKENERLGITNDKDKIERPDKKYWWAQLHRLITSKGSIENVDYTTALQAMECLSEGLYSIQWRAAAVAFWTDYNLEFRSNPEWQFTYEDQEMDVIVATTGGDFVQKVCLNEAGRGLFNEGKCVTYSYENDQKEQNPVVDEKKKSVDNDRKNSIMQVNSGDKSDQSGDDTAKSSQQSNEVTPRIPERILLGNTGGGQNLYWEFGYPDLPNRHILIFGSSGTGKTYAIQCLLAELSKSGQNSLIVDYTNGFTSQQLEKEIKERLKPTQHIVRQEPVPINPFRKQCDYIDDLEIEESSINVAQRVTGVFSEVYSLGDQQRSALYNAIRTGVEKEGPKFTLKKLLERLREAQAEAGPTANAATSVISKIQPFVDMDPFGQEETEGWEKMFGDPISRCHIIQLATFAKDTSKLITEFSLFDLYRFYRGRGSEKNPKVIVLDEIQNLNHNLSSPLGQFLTEGRKFGISLILATQTLSNLDRDQRDRLFQASHKLFFKPAETEAKSFAQILENSTNINAEEWVKKLLALKRGECYSLGLVRNELNNKYETKCYKIKIKSLKERF